jgi:hypothetical protein
MAYDVFILNNGQKPGHQPKQSGSGRPTPPTGGSGVKPPSSSNLRPASDCLAFFASVIKSGESWSETCEDMYREAQICLRNGGRGND